MILIYPSSHKQETAFLFKYFAGERDLQKNPKCHTLQKENMFLTPYTYGCCDRGLFRYSIKPDKYN